MAPFPLVITEVLGRYGAYLLFLLIGFAFGYVLEIAGFGNSRKLAAQFYLTEMTVLKVMFTAIVVAMVLIFAASALGLLDVNLLWINPTYLWPGIVGGLIMGFGFIIGGFCPGTSLVAMATMKIDGLFFVLGAVFGIFLFGETVDSFYIFWNSSYYGRLMLPEWLGLDTGVVVLGVVLMALFMFWGGEQLERIIGKRDLSKEPKARYTGAALLVVGAVAVLLIGQPTTLDRWLKIAPEKDALLIDRSVQIEPGELLYVMHDHELKLVMLDVREEADYNLFHLADARRVTVDELSALSSELHLEPPETVFVLMSNDEIEATKAWKMLLAESVPNVYILEGGINGWLDIFSKDDIGIRPLEGAGEGELRYEFASALGAAYQIADPDFHEYELEFTPKIKMELKRAPSGGGCG